ncbi:hypothetical protein PANT_26d00018 [Moesziomyces antarcticus T-34]|uniref:Uncharacterized protein n=1 Tax=Pseudozyma antarctica (strain T-34) TaxID=1151754 RepID=M9M165_PSEA3|nr:hypothetical protein PANT_26d00018 [Moesziomyces antarcticus T-34]
MRPLRILRRSGRSAAGLDSQSWMRSGARAHLSLHGISRLDLLSISSCPVRDVTEALLQIKMRSAWPKRSTVSAVSYEAAPTYVRLGGKARSKTGLISVWQALQRFDIAASMHRRSSSGCTFAVESYLELATLPHRYCMLHRRPTRSNN